MKAAGIFILATLFAVFSSCKKDPDDGPGTSLPSETIPAGWQISSTSSQYTLITLDNAEDAWLAGAQSIAKQSGSAITDYSASVAPYLPINSQISAIRTDNNDHLWLGLNNYAPDSSAGLIMLDGSVWQSYSPQNSGLNDNRVHSIDIDALNIKWIGTESSLVKYDGSAWAVYDSSNSPLREFYPVLCSNGYTWIGGQHSLTRFDGTTFTSWNTGNSSFPSTGVKLIETDNAGNVWFTGYNLAPLNEATTLWKFDGASFTSYPVPVSQNSGGEIQLCETMKADAQNNLWLAGHCFVLKFNGLSWTRYNVPGFSRGGDPRIERTNYAYLYSLAIKSDSTKYFVGSFHDHELFRFKE